MSSSFVDSDSSLNLVNLFYFNNHNNHPVDLLVGEIIIWPTNSNYPKGFLLCDGSSYNKTEYSELYAVISNTYGSGTGTFKVPDFRNKHMRSGNVQGNNIQVGTDGGNNTIIEDNLPSHKHNISYNDDNWIYNVNTVINYNIPNLVIARPNVTDGAQKQSDVEVDADGSRVCGSHTHNIAYGSSSISLNYTINTIPAVGPRINTFSSYINNAPLKTLYSTDTSPFTGGTSYVPKSKKVYYLIYSGKH